ncbi:ribonuclease E inhibitor RraB [Henriciella litoralis]|uniref:ribonuclease E inhibitor RraB n=1 Tax=Henriciella litoralis TaxID=568102 RepID=UPI000A036D4D|nr:ribonuclease E inhibitor RraB [Henriciella litoralis]
MIEHVYPTDADGEALRLVQEHGSDMSAPMVIDFAIDVPNEAVADFCVKRLKSRELESEKFFDEESARWSVYVPVMMTPVYEEIVDFQNALDEDLKQFGAKSDGWGTFGNNTDNQCDSLKKGTSQ